MGTAGACIRETTGSSQSGCCVILPAQDQAHTWKVLIVLKMFCGSGLQNQNQNPDGHFLPAPLCLWDCLLTWHQMAKENHLKAPDPLFEEQVMKGELGAERPLVQS